jgi:type IV secretion system protein VirB2
VKLTYAMKHASSKSALLVSASIVFIGLLAPELALAGFAEACTKVTGFFSSFETILRVASVSIVTIAVVFAGYQIAFAHKRLSDVAPVLIGGLLIGGAATIAGWFVGDWTPNTGAAAECGTAAVQVVSFYS